MDIPFLESKIIQLFLSRFLSLQNWWGDEGLTNLDNFQIFFLMASLYLDLAYSKHSGYNFAEHLLWMQNRIEPFDWIYLVAKGIGLRYLNFESQHTPNRSNETEQ